jgi:cellulose synthase/poly-beta-1,6-N-acetylglucosamine synthase-like glycosyltransferase
MIAHDLFVLIGDCAPFVGHNAFLRWKAIQSVSFMEDGVEKFWSESHVSEDFDMSLRLQTAGFVVRLATYGTSTTFHS